MHLIKPRKEVVQSELPKTMYGLCRDAENFSKLYLFADDLKHNKEVSRVKQSKHTVHATH